MENSDKISLILTSKIDHTISEIKQIYEIFKKMLILNSNLVQQINFLKMSFSDICNSLEKLTLESDTELYLHYKQLDIKQQEFNCYYLN